MVEVDRARPEHSCGADCRPRPGDPRSYGCCGGYRRRRTGLDAPLPGMAVRRYCNAASRSAESRSFGGGAQRGARIRRHFLVTRAGYARDRVESVPLKARIPDSYRVMPRRYRASLLGTIPADSRFCFRNAGYTVLYAAPDFATAFVETVVRDRFRSNMPIPIALFMPLARISHQKMEWDLDLTDNAS